MSDTQSLKFRLLVQASPKQVYDALTHAGALIEWLCNVAEVDAREGGRIYLWWQSGYYASGEFIRLAPGEKVVFSWHGRNEPGITQIKINLDAQEDGGTLISLSHSQIGESKVWKAALREFKKGWRGALENLKSALETGQDLRLVRRPMLGVTGLEEVTPALAESQGLPVSSGLRLEGVVEGYGAAEAGLQKDDILIKLGGEKVASYGDLLNVLQQYQAGDTIKAGFYRQGEKQSVKITLSPRSLPPAPASLDDLINNVKSEYAKAEKALSQALSGVSEAEASFQSGPEDWSVKHVLGHLIATERSIHEWLIGILEGRDPNQLTYHSNHSGRIQALVKAFGSQANLLREAKRSFAETLALLAALPAEVAERKSLFWQMGLNLGGIHEHTQAHARQITELITQARNPQPEAAAEPEAQPAAEAESAPTPTPEPETSEAE